MGNTKMKWLIFVAALCVLSNATFAINRDDVHPDWVYENLDSFDRLICVESLGNDVFFVARSKGLVKVGSLLDVDGGVGYPSSFITSLRFLDQNGEAIGKPDKPNILKEDYLKVGGKYFAERVSTYHIYTEDLRSIGVTLLLKKYADDERVPEKQDLRDSDLMPAFECRSNW